MKQWFEDNSDKVLLLSLVVMFFLGAFVTAKFQNSPLMSVALDSMKFVLGALVGLITGKVISSTSKSEPPGGPPPGSRGA